MKETRKLLREYLIRGASYEKNGFSYNDDDWVFSPIYSEFLDPERGLTYLEDDGAYAYKDDVDLTYKGEQICTKDDDCVILCCGEHEGRYARKTETEIYGLGDCPGLKSELVEIEDGHYIHYNLLKSETVLDYKGRVIYEDLAGYMTAGSYIGKYADIGKVLEIKGDYPRYSMFVGDLIIKSDKDELDRLNIKYEQWEGETL